MMMAPNHTFRVNALGYISFRNGPRMAMGTRLCGLMIMKSRLFEGFDDGDGDGDGDGRCSREILNCK